MDNSFKNFVETSDILQESSLSRLWRKYKDSDSGTITAYRDEIPLKEKQRRNAELKAILIGAGYSVTAIDGYYYENYGTEKEKRVKEKSFIVFDYKNTGNLERDLRRLGELYDQDSITYNSVKDGNYYIIGTSKRPESWPGYNVKRKLGRPMFGVKGEMWSEVKGRPFVFKEDSINESERHAYDDTLFRYGVWHIKALKDKAKEILN